VAVDDKRSPDLDGPIAAPDHHRVVFENDRVRVLETVVRPGDTTPLHTYLRRTWCWSAAGATSSGTTRREP